MASVGSLYHEPNNVAFQFFILLNLQYFLCFNTTENSWEDYTTFSDHPLMDLRERQRVVRSSSCSRHRHNILSASGCSLLGRERLYARERDDCVWFFFYLIFHTITILILLSISLFYNTHSNHYHPSQHILVIAYMIPLFIITVTIPIAHTRWVQCANQHRTLDLEGHSGAQFFFLKLYKVIVKLIEFK